MKQQKGEDHLMKNDKKSMVFSKNQLKGDIDAPSSKSYTHRAIIAASLARGKSKISNITYSEDIHATINAVRAMGAKVEIHDHYCYVNGVKKVRKIHEEVKCKESGSTLRFAIPVFALSNKKFTITGKPSLMKRPLDVYKEIFTTQGDEYHFSENRLTVEGKLQAKTYEIDGTISSQFLTGLMFALPLLKDDSTIKIKIHLESKSYIDITIDLLDEFGIKIKEMDDGYFIKGNQSYQAIDYAVEGDYSQAAFFLVGGQLNGAIRINNLDHDSPQGDQVIVDIIRAMKGRVIYSEEGLVCEKTKTKATNIDIKDCPDLGPILSLLACLSVGQTRISNIERLRIKESDRVASTVETLKALGASIRTSDTEIIIQGQDTLKGGVTVDSHNDHRIAMMVAIASLVCEQPITLTNPQAVNKSYPDFYRDFQALGGNIDVKD
jgi:3-phosphoshikimate 1-carboxyvinyltransferase